MLSDSSKATLKMLDIIIKEYENLIEMNQLRIKTLSNIDNLFTKGAKCSLEAREITYRSRLKVFRDSKDRALKGLYEG